MTIDYSEATINPSVEKMAAEFFHVWKELGETVDLGPTVGAAGHTIRESHLNHLVRVFVPAKVDE